MDDAHRVILEKIPFRSRRDDLNSRRILNLGFDIDRDFAVLADENRVIELTRTFGASKLVLVPRQPLFTPSCSKERLEQTRQQME